MNLSNKEKLLLLWCGLSIGNFIWESIGGHQWQIAIERSFFQGVAIVCCLLLFRDQRKVCSDDQAKSPCQDS